jgi:hypothetical protein
LINYKPNFTIKFIFWDEEEIGSNGSKFYADSAKKYKQNTKLILNLDMLAWDEDNDRQVRIKYLNSSSSQNYADSVIKICEEYELNLKPKKVTASYTIGFSGDADWFWENGYSAVGIADFCEYIGSYHSQGDLIKLFNKEYFLENTKLALAVLLRFGYIEFISNNVYSEKDLNKISVLPNPCTDFIEINISESNDIYFDNKIEIFNSFGICFSTHLMTSSKLINIESLSPGLYFIRIGNQVKKLIKI